MELGQAVKVDDFESYVDREIQVARETGIYNKWRVYEHLKKTSGNFSIAYSTAIKIIVEKLEL